MQSVQIFSMSFICRTFCWIALSIPSEMPDVVGMFEMNLFKDDLFGSMNNFDNIL